MRNLNDLLLRFRAARATLQEVEQEKKDDQTALIEALKKAKATMHEVPLEDEGVIVKGTLVEAEELRIDYDALWDELTPKQRKMVAKLVIDKELLEAAVVQGDIDATLVEKHSELYPKAPYIRITERAIPKKKAPRKKVRR